MNNMKYYTGVGSRSVPADVVKIMEAVAVVLAKQGYILRSGHADGSDKAFERGCDLVGGKKNIYLARHATDAARAIAERYHPAWGACSQYARDLHGRNSFQVLGDDLKTASEFLICWTPDGITKHSLRSKITGGTGTAISIADREAGIPIYNIGNPAGMEFVMNLLNGNNETMNIWWGTNENRELSNLAYRPFMFQGRQYITVEHAYQTLKSGEFDAVTFNKKWEAGTKHIGTLPVNKKHSHTMMFALIMLSFVSNPDAMATLVATGDAVLTHTQDRGYWRDAFPAILMDIRKSNK